VANARGFIFFTHALPGQQGYHHVNCRTPEYWLERFSAFGCTLDHILSATARSLAPGYFARTGLVFRPNPGEEGLGNPPAKAADRVVPGHTPSLRAKGLGSGPVAAIYRPGGQQEPLQRRAETLSKSSGGVVEFLRETGAALGRRPAAEPPKKKGRE
jgi:hypothetical protein